jgi:hypothetical protein
MHSASTLISIAIGQLGIELIPWHIIARTLRLIACHRSRPLSFCGQNLNKGSRDKTFDGSSHLRV